MVVCVEKVRQTLAWHRESGETFALAWPATLAALPASDQLQWLETLEHTVGAWRSAYNGQSQSRPQRALEVAGYDPEREPTNEPDPWASERACVGCGAAISSDKRAHARFCGRACRQRAWHEERAA